MINEPDHEGTCNIKDVGIDTIHTFTQSHEEESQKSSYDSDDSNNASIHDNTYSTSNSDSSIMNVRNMCIDPIAVKAQYIVHSGIENGTRGRSIGFGQLNINVHFNDHVVTLPGLETFMQGSLLELDLSV